jgi:hypothetical protein
MSVFLRARSAPVSILILAAAGSLLASAAAPGGEGFSPETRVAGRSLRRSVEVVTGSEFGIDLGVEVFVEGRGYLYRRQAEVPRPAASAIKAFVLLDLIREGPPVDGVPHGAQRLLYPGVHIGFSGFSGAELARARTVLAGKTYGDLARIMMGRTESPNDVYNAACNLLMIKLGGPRRIAARVRGYHPEFATVDINRYMQRWNHDGDNRVSPSALVALYRMVSEGRVPGLDPPAVARLRELLLEEGNGGPGSRFGKQGTLYPDPMARIQAGYREREGGDVVFAVMGELRNTGTLADRDAFVVLLAAVDSVAAMCAKLP